jgi:hypothetical protein
MSTASVDAIGPALARAEDRLLSQYLLACPGCAQPSAAHVDRRGDLTTSAPVLVRFVCPVGCAVTDAAVLALLPIESIGLSA